MADSFNKKQKEKKKERKRKEKQARKEARKAENEEKGSSLDDMIAYVDEYGNIVDTPPEESDEEEIKAEDIVVGVPPKEEGEEEDPVKEGKVTFFHDEKAYGFIKDKSSNESYFVHMNNCTEPIAEGDRVEFELQPGKKGPEATNVKRI